jgi:hypothetical protein
MAFEKLRSRDDDPLDFSHIVIATRASVLKTAIEEALRSRWPLGTT